MAWERAARAADIDCHGVDQNMRIHSLFNCSQTVLRTARLGLALTLGVACGGTPSTPVVSPIAPASAPSGTAGALVAAPVAPSDPFTLPSGPRDEDAADAARGAVDLEPWKKAKTAKGVPPPPAACAAYVSRVAAKDASGLVEALGDKDPAKRDARLVTVDAQNAKLKGAWTRAVRAELAPIECADAITDPFLQSYVASADPEAAERVRLVVGFSLAGKLSRTASAPPSMGAIRDKEKVKAFVGGPLKTWLLEQSTAIEVLSSGAAGLTGYARGVAAIEAGIAELRLVDKMRSAPVPATWDPELKAIYDAALDEALEPRKKRGRDATLVGMSDFARAGILRDARLDRARVLLSKLYGGRRIDALEGLLVPAVVVPSPVTSADFAMTNVPIVWLQENDIASPDDPRTLLRGVTRNLRARFRKLAVGAPDELRSSYARARLDMGRVYWRRIDFVEAAYAAKGSDKPEDHLVLAVSLALAQGPNGAADMMRAATPAALELRHTEALDALVAEGGALAGMAAFDAAHLRALSPTEREGAAAYLKDVAARFRKAESLLSDPVQKKVAAQRAADVEAIATSAK